MHCDNQRKLRAKVVGQKQQQRLRCNHKLCDNQRNLWEKVVGRETQQLAHLFRNSVWIWQAHHDNGRMENNVN